jgi:hypothetical protein
MRRRRARIDRLNRHSPDSEPLPGRIIPLGVLDPILAAAGPHRSLPGHRPCHLARRHRNHRGSRVPPHLAIAAAAPGPGSAAPVGAIPLSRQCRTDRHRFNCLDRPEMDRGGRARCRRLRRPQPAPRLAARIALSGSRDYAHRLPVAQNVVKAHERPCKLERNPD